jgi:hypothetical protein
MAASSLPGAEWYNNLVKKSKEFSKAEPAVPTESTGNDLRKKDLTIQMLDGTVLETCMGVMFEQEKQSSYDGPGVNYKKFIEEMEGAADYDKTKHVLSGLLSSGKRHPIKTPGMFLHLMLDWVNHPTDESWKILVQDKGIFLLREKESRANIIV